MSAIHLKHQPRTWEGYIASPDVAKFRAAIDSGRWQGGAVLIQGPSSSGKTTLAGILAETCGDVVEVNGAGCGVDKVEYLAGWMRTRLCFGENDWRAVVVNECQCMTTDAAKRWLDVLDHLAPRVIVIFTSMADTRAALKENGEAFVSRCRVIQLNRPDESAAIARLQEICKIEGITATDWQLAELLKREGRNLRACIEKLDDLPVPPVPTVPVTVPTPVAVTPVVATIQPIAPPPDDTAARSARIAAAVERVEKSEPPKRIEPKAVVPPLQPSQLIAFVKTQGIKMSPGEAELVLIACNGSMDRLEQLLKLPIRQLNEGGIAIDAPKAAKARKASTGKPKAGKAAATDKSQHTKYHVAIAWIAAAIIAYPAAELAWYSVSGIAHCFMAVVATLAAI